MTVLILKVIEAKIVADRVVSLRLADADGIELPAFAAGAHVEVTLPDGQTRPYSLIDFDGSSAAPRAYHLGVLRESESRGGSVHMHGLSIGDSVTLAPPKNDFALQDGPAPSLLIAGGIGVTPMISMATTLQAQGRPYRLVYAGRSASTMAFTDQLAAQHGPSLTLHHDDTAGGPLDLRPLIAAASPGTQVYVCGPRPMIEAARELATAAGLPVHFESFDAVTAQQGDTAFEVEVASTGDIFTIPPGRTIVEVLEEAGIDLMHDCLRGDCGICQTDVLAGVPDHRDVVLTDAERAEGKLIHICVSRAKSPRLTLDL